MFRLLASKLSEAINNICRNRSWQNLPRVHKIHNSQRRQLESKQLSSSNRKTQTHKSNLCLATITKMWCRHTLIVSAQIPMVTMRKDNKSFPSMISKRRKSQSEKGTWQSSTILSRVDQLPTRVQRGIIRIQIQNLAHLDSPKALKLNRRLSSLGIRRTTLFQSRITSHQQRRCLRMQQSAPTST